MPWREDWASQSSWRRWWEWWAWSPAPWRNLLPEIHDKMTTKKVVFTWSKGWQMVERGHLLKKNYHWGGGLWIRTLVEPRTFGLVGHGLIYPDPLPFWHKVCTAILYLRVWGILVRDNIHMCLLRKEGKLKYASKVLLQPYIVHIKFVIFWPGCLTLMMLENVRKSLAIFSSWIPQKADSQAMPTSVF